MSFIRRPVHSLSTAALVTLVSLSACDDEASGLPTWEEFLANASDVADGEVVYTIEGDLPATLEEVERAYAELLAAEDGVAPRSIVRLDGGEFDIWRDRAEHNLVYCISNEFNGDKARVVREVANAARAWEQAADVDFRYAPGQDANCTEANPAVIVAVRPWGATRARSFFPNDGRGTLWMNMGSYDAGGTSTTGIFRHELGHILGLRHEQIRPESGASASCYEDDNWAALGAYDRRSVMHYWNCNGIFTDGSLTLSDQQGIRALYGPPAVSRHDDGTPADFNGDGRADLALTGPVGWASLPVALSTGAGFTVHNKPAGGFAGFAAIDGVMTAAGDFNGDGRTDVAATGPSWWSSLPVAFSDGTGDFAVTNINLAQWPDWAEQDNARLLTGDFNADGKTDLALTGPVGWQSLPVALSNGNGTFAVHNTNVGYFANWSSELGAHRITGDFDGDGDTDVALTGPNGWASLPLARSNGNGSFTVTNHSLAWFGQAAAEVGATVVAGDFNGDSRTDIALSGVDGWQTIPVAFSNGDGSFYETNGYAPNFAAWSHLPGAHVLTGDFNGDGRTDLALTGHSAWDSVPVALSNGDGNFTVRAYAIPSFGGWSAMGARPFVGDFNGDGATDIALTGPASFVAIPVAYSTGTGNFSVQQYVSSFPGWASTQGVVAVW